MKTIETTGTVSADGVLTIQVPRDVPPGKHAVVVVIDEQPQAPEQLDELGWPIGFFDQTAGALADTPLERGDQGTYEVRKELE
jgi:hypothetical protein